MLTTTEIKKSTLTDPCCCPQSCNLPRRTEDGGTPGKAALPSYCSTTSADCKPAFPTANTNRLGRGYPQQVIANCRQAPGLEQTLPHATDPHHSLKIHLTKLPVLISHHCICRFSLPWKTGGVRFGFIR